MKKVVGGNTREVEGVILVYLLRVADVIIIALRYYPILIAVQSKTICILLCTTLYVWLDFSLTIVDQGMCDTDYYPIIKSLNQSSQLETVFSYFGTGSTLLIIELCTDIPRYLCLTYLSIKFPVMPIKKIRDRNSFKMQFTREERILFRISQSDSTEMIYLRNLLTPTDKRPASPHLVARIIP